MEDLYKKEDLYKNPFSGVNAAQMDDEEILDYWCDPFQYGIASSTSALNIYDESMNLVFMGGRSTGKSMFLRYWSYPVQQKIAAKGGQKLTDIISKNQGVGLYFRIDGPILKSFEGSGLSLEHWRSVFAHYFELVVANQCLELLSELHHEQSISDRQLQEIILKLSIIIRSPDIVSLEHLLDEFQNRIREVYEYLGNAPLYKREFLPNKGAFLSQQLSFGIPDLMLKQLSCLKDLNIVLLIDEYENFSEDQQRILNTLMRFSKPRIKLRIGMRLEGFKTDAMISSEDFIKEKREYRKIIFEDILPKHNLGYTDFLIEVCKKRLETVPQFKKKKFTDIRAFLGEKEDLEEEAVEIVGDDHERIAKYFEKRIPKSDLRQIIFEKNPLLFLLNCIWLTRKNSVHDTKTAMNDYLKGNKTKAGKKYRLDYVDKYKLSLTFLLCSIFKTKKLYYSFNTFAFLSSGIVGNFIELCRTSFAVAEWAEPDELFNHGKVSRKIQTKAATEVANDEKQQIAKIENYGGMISRFVQNIGNIFYDFHHDPKMRYPETNQFAINKDSIDEKDLRNAFSTAIRWSMIQKKPRMQKTEPSGDRQDIYILNRLFSPSFQISYRTRGGKSIALDEGSLKELMTKDVNSKDYSKINIVLQNQDKTNNEPITLF